MFKRHQLRALVNERLKAAAEEIFRIFETTIKDYEEIILRSQQEVDQQQSRLAAWEGSLQEEAPPSEPCPFEKKTDLYEDDQEPPWIKEEQQEEEELWTAQPGDNQQEEADTKHSMFNIIYTQRQDDDAQQFPHKNLEAAKEADHLNTSSHRQLKSEPDKEGCDASEATGACQMSEVSDDAGRVCGGFDSGAIGKKPWQGDETADSSHTCSICNRNFRIKSILTRHMKTHTGEKPYSCGVCYKSFIQRSYLHTHMNSHSGKKPHTCSFCGRGFTQVGNMNAHIRIHTGEKPHSCTDCGKRFREKADLIKHKIIHTGEKPYICTVCEMKFSAQSNLTRHTKTHSGERPYSCPSCGKKFIRRSHLLIHMKTHAGESL